MNWDNWPTLAALTVGTVGWLVRLERRLNSMLTRDEHAVLVKETAEEQKACLKEIRDAGLARDDKATQFRHDTRDGLNQLNLQLRLLIQENRLRRDGRDMRRETDGAEDL